MCREQDITRERIEMILAAGANVVLTTKGIDDLCTKYFVEAGCIAIRRVEKKDIRQIAKATGGAWGFSVTMREVEGTGSCVVWVPRVRLSVSKLMTMQRNWS